MPINEQNLKKSLADHKNGTEFSVNETKNITPKKENSISREILEINKENNRLLKKVVRYQRWETFFSFFKILIIVAPLIAAYIYLTPMLSQALNGYQDLLGTDSQLQTTTGNLKELDNVNIKDQLRELLK
ncbi:MAG: hypothetical protein ABIC82_01695 [bacterium]